SSLQEINSADKNIITLEDPVEYRMKGICQIQINPGVDLTFANGLRSILRQDPDIILVGEIRDLDTAEMAVHASLTGHLVLSTLHTNDAPGAMTRLTDMGIEPFLIASSLIGVLAQRLVRLCCTSCGGPGCEQCFQSGYRGRTGIYELMLPNEELRQLVTQKAPTDDIRQAALKSGMKTMYDDGMQKVEAGLTTKEEVLRVISEG
ncbi:MAG: Flp pilus assembly complex ATPase component TadA, partial [Candidatus Omnitrophica bacterium]|nr:Flp pilus assembly complex ATPase component TadA [Candidatus Omnitrophota bacterium]